MCNTAEIYLSKFSLVVNAGISEQVIGASSRNKPTTTRKKTVICLDKSSRYLVSYYAIARHICILH